MTSHWSISNIPDFLLTSRTYYLLITNLEGNYVFVNDHFKEQFAFISNDFIGLASDIAIHPEDVGKCSEAGMKALSANKTVGNIIIRKPHATEEYRWSQWEFSPLMDNGIPKGVICIGHDLTEYERAKQQYIALLESKNQELQQFNYITSHDLQEPLRTIKSFVDLFQKDYALQLEGEASVYLKYINASADRMSQLITNLLEHSLIGKRSELEKINVNDLLQEVILDQITSIKANEAKIHFGNLPMIQAYRVELRSLFQNLLSNSIKFRSKQRQPEIEISYKDKSDHYEFCIQDNGIGIDEIHHASVFQIFHRLHNNHEYSGTGIGLAHCRKIVELHKGQIWLESKLDTGSQFYFTINKVL
jgi:PAS domain S-box-containing protein